MKVKLGAYGILRGYLGESEPGQETEVAPDKSIRQIIAELGIPDGMVMIASVNDQQQNLDYIPKAGDDIKLIPPISGG